MGRYIENSEWGAKNLVDFVLAVRQAMGAAAASVRYDSAQDLTSAQQETARSNIGAAGLSAPVFSDGITVSGGATISGGMTVNGNFKFGNNAIFSQTVSSGGSSTTHSAGITMNASSLNFGLYDWTHGKWIWGMSISGNVWTDSPLIVNSGATIKNGLTVSGGATISGGLTVNTTVTASAGVFSQYASATGFRALSYYALHRDANDDRLVVYGGKSTTEGGYLVLYGKDHASAGKFTLAAVAGSGSACSLQGTWDGSLTWGGTITASTFSGTATSAVNASSLGGVAASNYLPKSGGTLSGGLTVSANGGAAAMWVDNGYTDSKAHKGALYANTAGNFGVYDTTKSKWLIYNDSAGATHFPQAATFAGSVFAQTSGNVGFVASNTSSLRKIDMRAQNNGNAGIWDTDNGHWMVHATSGGKTAVCYSGATTDLVIEDIGGNTKTVRFPGGMQLCYGSGSASTASGCAISFGSAFSETPSIMATARPTAKPTVTHACHVVSGSTTGATVWLIDGSTIRGGNIFWMAIGKYK